MSAPEREQQRRALLRVLERLQIGDPIKTLMRPRFRVCEIGAAIRLTISSIAADGSGARIDVAFHEEIPPFADEQHAAAFLYSILNRALRHELAESVRFDGAYIEHPHPELTR